MNPSPHPLPDPTSEPLLPFPESSPPPPREAPKEGKPSETEPYWDFCPNCGAHLEHRGCKHRCPRCSYFMSCSDFD